MDLGNLYVAFVVNNAMVPHLTIFCVVARMSLLAYPQFQWLQQAMKLAVAYDLQVQIVHFNLIFVSLMFDVIRI
jgi:hypothetical protein